MTGAAFLNLSLIEKYYQMKTATNSKCSHAAHFTALLAVTCMLAVACAVTAAEQPNIIVIMADDLGYGDVSCYRATALTTPSIDRLASEGVRFTDGYCSASTCTPTRFSFLTGTYAFRQKGTGIAPPNGPALIKPGTETLRLYSQTPGYATAVIGKWHLGLGNRRRTGTVN